jgi:hypothetical protein
MLARLVQLSCQSLVVTTWAVGRQKDSEEVIRFQKEFFDSIELLASDNVSLHNHADFISDPTHF